MIPNEIRDILRSTFKQSILDAKTDGGTDPFIRVASDTILEVARFLRDSDTLSFDVLMCLSGMDYGNGELGVVYHLHSMKWNHKITLKVILPNSEPTCQSVESIWKTANWHEREAFDLFGIRFEGHPDLRRILLPDDWQGHPLRKDYQLPEFYNGMKVPY
jgi:NADH-quinone oxidoreductase subunit C